MTTSDDKAHINLRAANLSDSNDLAVLLNEIIIIGGTTAFETELSPAEFEARFLNGENYIHCFLAESNNMLLGFQSLSLKQSLPNGWLDIATFTRAGTTVKGVGRSLFGLTQAFVSKSDYAFINATIRADNVSGLAYYSKMGFVDYAVSEAVPLQSGTPVDRISKKYAIPPANS